MRKLLRGSKRTDARRLLGAFMVFALLVGAGFAFAAQRQAKVPAAASVLEAEKGRFRVVLDGATVGSEEFQISASGNEWMATGKVEVKAPGAPPAMVNARLRLTRAGNPVHYEWSAGPDKKISATVEFQDGGARLAVIREGSEPHLQGFVFPSPRVIILDNNFYHHYAILARLYDWKTGGIQSFPVLIPQELTPGTISVERLDPQQTGDGKLDVLRVRSPDLEIDLFLDKLRLVRIAVPGSNAEVIRE